MSNDKLDLTRIRQAYNHRDEIWPTSDPWHHYTGTRLFEIAGKFIALHDRNGRTVLNVGPGAAAHGSTRVFHVDIAEKWLIGRSLSVVGSLDHLPFNNCTFDAVLCVGSVLNYCDVVAGVSEVARVLRPGGYLLLEFESSTSGEYLFTNVYGRAATLIKTSYGAQEERLWIYRPRFVKDLLQEHGIAVEKHAALHTVTALMFRLVRDERLARIIHRAA